MSFRNILQIATVAPLSRKAASREPARQEEPLLQRESEPGLAQPYAQSYGATDRQGQSSTRSSRRPSPEVHRRESTLNMVLEEDNGVQDSPVAMQAEEDGDEASEAEEVEWDLEERGLYSGLSQFPSSQ